MVDPATLMVSATGLLKVEIPKQIFRYLIKSILEVKTDLQAIVRSSIKDSISDFQSEFNDVEVFTDDQFMSVLNEIASEATGANDSESVGFKETLSSKIFSQSLIFHPIEDTKKIYSESFSDKFCFRLYTNLLGSKYANLLQAKEAIAASEFRESTTEKLESLHATTSNSEEMLKAIWEKIGTIHPNKNNFLSGYGVSNDFPELTDSEDSEIADLFNQIDALAKAETNFLEQVALAKRILAKVPPSRINLYHKAYNTLLGCYLRGSEDDWKTALSENEQWSGSRSPYSNVLLAAINNNLRNWGVALQLITGIPRADLATLSEKQKDSYHVIYALIKHHLKRTAEAQKLLDKCENKNDNEYLHILFYIHSRNKESNLLGKVTEILSGEKYNSSAVHSAVYYIIDRFSILQSDLGNGIDALTELRPHLELAFSRTKKVIEENRTKESFPLKYLIVALPALARLTGRAKDAIDLVKLGIDRRYDGFFFLHNCAACFLEMNMLEDGILCCEKIGLKEMVLHDGLDLYLLLLSKSKQDSKFQNILEQLKDLNIADEKKWKAMVAACREIGDSKFIEIASEAFKKFSDSGWATLYLADSYILSERFDEAITLLKKGREKKEISLLATVHLAKLLAGKLHKYEEALEYYEEIIKNDTPVQEKMEYVLCLYNLDLYGEVIMKVDEFDPEAKIMRLQRIKAYSCTQMGMLPTAKEILKRVCSKEKENYEAHFNYACLCQNLGHNDDLVDALKEVVRIKPDDCGSHLLLSQALFNQRKFKEAVVHARFALLGDFQNQMAHFNFMNIHRVALDALPHDKFIHSTELEELHRDVLNNFIERFPDSKLMQRFEFKTNEDGVPDLGFLMEMLEEQNSWRENLLKMYRDQSLPISFLVTGMKRDIFEIWSYLISRAEESGLIVNKSTPQVLRKDAVRIKDSNSIVLDGISILCLKSAGILEELPKLGKNIIIGSKTAQDFIQIRHNLNSSTGGHLSVGLEDGKMVKEVISSEQVQSARTLFEEISTFITDKCSVLANERQSQKKDDDIKSILDNSYKELWDLNGTPNSISIWADGNLAALSITVGKHVSTLQSLILCLVEGQIISREQYAIVLGKMVLANYKGLVFTNEDAAIFISQYPDTKGEYYFRKLTKGPYFANMEGRVGFLSNLVVRMLNSSLDLKWLTQATAEFLVDQNVDYANKLLFGIGLYTNGITLGVEASIIDGFLLALDIRSLNDKVITPELCKSHIEEVVLQEKMAEVDYILKRLGVSEE